MATRADLVCIAAVAAPHGVRGALRLRCFTADPASVAAYGPLHDRDGTELFAVRVIGRAKGGVIVAAAGVTSREQAEALRGRELFVPRAALPAPGEDEFYYADLIGLAVLDPEGRPLGRVSAVTNHGAGDVIEIARPGAPPLLVPFTHAAVPQVDLAGGRIVVAPPVELRWEGEAA